MYLLHKVTIFEQFGITRNLFFLLQSSLYKDFV